MFVNYTIATSVNMVTDIFCTCMMYPLLEYSYSGVGARTKDTN